MSTRGAIVRLDQSREGFRGVYHHWDSYPSGLGATLYHTIRGHFHGDVERALQVLIDDHPAGWSSINGKDFSLLTGFNGMDSGECQICDGPGWVHYYQDWESHGKTLSPMVKAQMQAGNYLALGHGFARPDFRNPECFCHGDRHEERWEVTSENAAGSGVEYVYAFAGRKMLVLSSFNADGEKMIGFFGMGNPNAMWGTIGEVDLDDPQEPNWKEMQGF